MWSYLVGAGGEKPHKRGVQMESNEGLHRNQPPNLERIVVLVMFNAPFPNQLRLCLLGIELGVGGWERIPPFAPFFNRSEIILGLKWS